MKLKLEQIWGSQQALPKLLARDLPVRTAYWIGRNTHKIEAELKTLNDSRISLVKKYGKEDEKTKSWNIEPAKREVFEKAFAELLNTEINVDIKTVGISELGDIKLSAGECLAIEFMLKDDDDGKQEKPKLPEALEPPKRR